MKIVAVHIRDFKRLRDVKVTPEADRVLLLVGGKNAQGKSSLLDALTAAFGGKRALPPDPVRRGAPDAEIRVDLDNGMSIVRRIAPGGETVLEVRDADGALKSPQAVLDKLVGERFLDPLAFLGLPAKDQREALLKLVDRDGKIAELDARRERGTTKRADIARDLRKAEGELARLPVVTPGEEIAVADLAAEGRKLEEVQRAADAAHARKAKAADMVDSAGSMCDDLRRRIEALQAQLADAERKLAGWQKEHAEACTAADETAQAAIAAAARRTEIADRIASAQAHNRKVAQDQAAAARRAEVEGDVLRFRTEHAKVENGIADIDRQKAALLAAAQLPVPGLSVNDGAVTLDGVPLAQASQAERYRVAVALQIAAAPNLADIWVHDGSLLDEDSLALLAEVAQAAGVRLWVERVGDRDPGAIVIHDGTVRAAAQGAAA